MRVNSALPATETKEINVSLNNGNTNNNLNSSGTFIIIIIYTFRKEKNSLQLQAGRVCVYFSQSTVGFKEMNYFQMHVFPDCIIKGVYIKVYMYAR